MESQARVSDVPGSRDVSTNQHGRREGAICLRDLPVKRDKSVHDEKIVRRNGDAVMRINNRGDGVGSFSDGTGVSKKHQGHSGVSVGNTTTITASKREREAALEMAQIMFTKDISSVTLSTGTSTVTGANEASAQFIGFNLSTSELHQDPVPVNIAVIPKIVASEPRKGRAEEYSGRVTGGTTQPETTAAREAISKPALRIDRAEDRGAGNTSAISAVRELATSTRLGGEAIDMGQSLGRQTSVMAGSTEVLKTSDKGTRSFVIAPGHPDYKTTETEVNGSEHTVDRVTVADSVLRECSTERSSSLSFTQETYISSTAEKQNEQTQIDKTAVIEERSDTSPIGEVVFTSMYAVVAGLICDTVDEDHNCPQDHNCLQAKALPGAMRKDVYSDIRIHRSSEDVHREQVLETAAAVREHKRAHIKAEHSSESIVVSSLAEPVKKTLAAVGAQSLTSDTRAAVTASSECRDESRQNMALADHQEAHQLTKRQQFKRQDETTKHSTLQTLRSSAEADSRTTASAPRGNGSPAEHGTYDQALTTQFLTKQTTDTSAELNVGNRNSNDIITAAKSPGRFSGGISDQTRAQAAGVPILREKDVRRVSVQSQVACGFTQGLHESSVQQAVQVATKRTTVSPIELAAQSMSQQPTLTSADLDVGTRHTSSLVIASGSSGLYGSGTLLQKREDVHGLATSQAERESAQEVGQSSSVTARVVCTQEIDQMPLVQPTTQVITEESMQITSEQNALVSAEETMHTSTEQVTQTSTDINVGVGSSGNFSAMSPEQYRGEISMQRPGQAARVTSLQAIDDVERSVICQVARDSAQADGHISSLQETTQLSAEKTVLSSTNQTTQFTTHQNTCASEELDVGLQSSGNHITTAQSSGEYSGRVSVPLQAQGVEATVPQIGRNVQRTSGQGGVGLESPQRVGQSSSLQLTTQTLFSQVTHTSTELDIGAKNNTGVVQQTTQAATRQTMQSSTEKTMQSMAQHATQTSADVSMALEAIDSDQFVKDSRPSAAQLPTSTQQTTEALTQLTHQASAEIPVEDSIESCSMGLAGHSGVYHVSSEVLSAHAAAEASTSESSQVLNKEVAQASTQMFTLASPEITRSSSQRFQDGSEAEVPSKQCTPLDTQFRTSTQALVGQYSTAAEVVGDVAVTLGQGVEVKSLGVESVKETATSSSTKFVRASTEFSQNISSSRAVVQAMRVSTQEAVSGEIEQTTSQQNPNEVGYSSTKVSADAYHSRGMMQSSAAIVSFPAQNVLTSTVHESLENIKADTLVEGQSLEQSSHDRFTTDVVTAEDLSVEATCGTVEDMFDNSVISKRRGGTRVLMSNPSTDMVRAGTNSPIVILRDAEQCGM